MSELVKDAAMPPVATVAQGLGARWGEGVDGRRTALGYGDPEAEHAALSAGAALIDGSAWEVVELAGADRARFLNGLVTCEIEGLAPGASVHGFFTEVKGHILADVEVLADDDRLLLVLPPGQGEPMAAHLAKYKVADRVEIVPRDLALLVAAGPKAGPRLAGRLELESAPAPGELVAIDDAGGRVLVYASRRFGKNSYGLLAEPDHAARLFERLAASPEDAALRPAGARAFDLARVEGGLPLFGADYGSSNFPQETGLAEAVSYSKGCYLGQEVVARIHYRGGVRKSLRGLRLSGDEAPAPGAEVEHGGSVVGRLGTVARSSELGWIGLAILHERAAEPGTELSVAGGRAEVVDLPMRTAGETPD